MTTIASLALYGLLVVILIAAILVISYLLGERHQDRQTGEPYESGIVSTGSARMRFDVKFYLNAMLFVIFDLETVFIIAWVAAVREAGWPGYVEILLFIGALGVALVYLWRLGALDWKTSREKNTQIDKGN